MAAMLASCSTDLKAVISWVPSTMRWQAAKCAVLLGLGEEIEEARSTAYDGTYQVPYLELQPIAVTGENMDEVIIKGGFHAKEDVYLNVN